MWHLSICQKLLNKIVRRRFWYLAEAIEILAHHFRLSKPQIEQALVPVVIPNKIELVYLYVRKRKDVKLTIPWHRGLQTH
jgi:hypothetical protein